MIEEASSAREGRLGSLFRSIFGTMSAWVSVLSGSWAATAWSSGTLREIRASSEMASMSDSVIDYNRTRITPQLKNGSGGNLPFDSAVFEPDGPFRHHR